MIYRYWRLSESHAKTFAGNKLSQDSLSILDKPTLKELGLTVLGEALTILKQGTNTNDIASYHSHHNTSTSVLKLNLHYYL